MSSLHSASLLLCLALSPAMAAGIRVRFLANPAEDSVVRYEVWRCDSVDAYAGAASRLIGSLAADSARDTLAFPDSTARKGVAYLYSLRSLNAAGVASDFSDSARVALPRLDLPDTARPTAGLTRILLAPGAHPLAGYAPLVLALADSSRLRLVHDTAAGALVFLSPPGLSDTVTAVVRASYHGKFSDLDTVLVLTEGRIATLSIRPRRGRASAEPFLVRTAGGGSLLMAIPGSGRIRRYGPDGRLILSH